MSISLSFTDYFAQKLLIDNILWNVQYMNILDMTTVSIFFFHGQVGKKPVKQQKKKRNHFSAVFILCKVNQWAILDPLAVRFWSTGCMFDTPELGGLTHE